MKKEGKKGNEQSWGFIQITAIAAVAAIILFLIWKTIGGAILG